MLLEKNISFEGILKYKKSAKVMREHQTRLRTVREGRDEFGWHMKISKGLGSSRLILCILISLCKSAREGICLSLMEVKRLLALCSIVQLVLTVAQLMHSYCYYSFTHLKESIGGSHVTRTSLLSASPTSSPPPSGNEACL